MKKIICIRRLIDQAAKASSRGLSDEFLDHMPTIGLWCANQRVAHFSPNLRCCALVGHGDLIAEIDVTHGLMQSSEQPRTQPAPIRSAPHAASATVASAGQAAQ